MGDIIRFRDYAPKYRVQPHACEPCEGRGYFDSRHPGYRGHTTCSWCNGKREESSVIILPVIRIERHDPPKKTKRKSR